MISGRHHYQFRSVGATVGCDYAQVHMRIRKVEEKWVIEVVVV